MTSLPTGSVAPDLIVVGGGNAAMAGALAGRDARARVLVFEAAADR